MLFQLVYINLRFFVAFCKFCFHLMEKPWVCFFISALIETKRAIDHTKTHKSIQKDLTKAQIGASHMLNMVSLVHICLQKDMLLMRINYNKWHEKTNCIAIGKIFILLQIFESQYNWTRFRIIKWANDRYFPKLTIPPPINSSRGVIHLSSNHSLFFHPKKRNTFICKARLPPRGIYVWRV